MHLLRFASALLVGLFSFSAHAQAFKIDSDKSTAQFDIKHMLVSTAHGTIKGIVGTATFDEANPAGSKVSATLDVATINTGNDKRDTHLKSADYFDQSAFPQLAFNSTSFKRNADGTWEIAGVLTMHGVSKPVTLQTKVTGTATERKVSATTTLNRKDFGITSGGMMVGAEATITLDIVLLAT